jgi:hypothetical protein
VRRTKKIKDDGVRRFGLVALPGRGGFCYDSRVDKAGQRESIHDRDLYHCQPCFHLDGDRRDLREPSIVPSRVTMPRPAGKVPSLVGIRNSCQNQKGIPDRDLLENSALLYLILTGAVSIPPIIAMMTLDEERTKKKRNLGRKTDGNYYG